MNQIVRKLVLGIQEQFNGFDSAIKKFEDRNYQPPIFIIGSPRTGSTVLFQAMLSQFQLAYISNLMALLPALMVKMCHLWPGVAYGYAGNLRESQYGYIPGLFSPNEAGRLCRKWFAESDSQDEDVRRTFAAISSITDCPVLIKNLANSNRLKAIRRILPDSWFIFLQREPLFTAQSILLARRELMETEAQWWSVKPAGYEQVLDKPPAYQVLWQILSIENNIRNQIDDRVVTMQYETFCQAPQSSLEHIREGIGLKWRTDSQPLVTTLPVANRIRLPDKEWQNLVQTYDELLKQFE